MGRRTVPNGAETGTATAIAAFMVSPAVLELLVQQGTLTHRATGLKLLELAMPLDRSDPAEKPAHRLLMDLSKSHSDKHRRLGPSRPRAKAMQKRGARGTA